MGIAKLNTEQKLDREISALLQESTEPYLTINTREKVTYDDFLSNKIWIIAAIRTGIPYTLFRLIQDYTPFSDSDWASFLDISTKSLQRYKSAPKYHFKPIHSEKIIEMAEVTKVGLDTFGSNEKLKLWLQTPNYSLGNLKPIELLRDSYGKELVLAELTRISHGIFV